MKWSKRIAQGFLALSGASYQIALKVADRTAEQMKSRLDAIDGVTD
jgi:hypothetical protein